MNRLYKAAIKILPWLVVAGIGLFFYRTLKDNYDKLGDVSFEIDGWVLLGILSFTLAVVVSGILWGRLLGKLTGLRVEVHDAVRIHCASWLLKYIPGQVGSYLNKIAWGASRGISKKKISTSFIYENVLMVIAGLVLSVPVVLLFKDTFAGNLELFIPALMVVPLIVVFSRKLFYGLINRVFALIGKKPFGRDDFLTGPKLLQYQLGYLVPRLLNGVGFVFIVHSMVDVQPSMYIGLAATYILASIIGLLAIFVPGGLGVREAVIVAFLSVYFPVEQAIIIALVTRLYATISDAGVALIYVALNKGKIRQL
jgi:glycosyltransferase 2 family protein